MSLEAWGDSDEEMRGPDGYVTEEYAREMVQEAVKSITEERDELARRIGDQSARLATVMVERDGLRKMFEDEKATSTDLENLNELMTLDFERERAENERLRKALNQIAMSAMSSEYAKGRAAIALQGE